MDEQSTEVIQDTPTPEETVTPPDGGADVQTDADANAKPATDVNKLYARMKKAEARVKELEAQAQTPTEHPSTKSNPAPSSDQEWRERIELRTDGYSPEEVDAIMELGGRKAVGNPIVKEAVASIRKRARSEAATPTDTAKAPVFKKYTQAELDAMSVEDLEKILPRAD